MSTAEPVVGGMERSGDTEVAEARSVATVIWTSFSSSRVESIRLYYCPVPFVELINPDVK